MPPPLADPLSTCMRALPKPGPYFLVVTVLFSLLSVVVHVIITDQHQPAPVRVASAEITELSTSNPLGVVLIAGVSRTGGSTCSAVPLKGTNMVVSAAHCVVAIDGTSLVYPGITVRDPTSVGLLAVVKAVRFDQRYLEGLEPRFDLAVLYTNRVWSTGVDMIEPLQTSRDVTVHALQRVRSNGWYLVAEGDFWRFAITQCVASEVMVPTSEDGMFNVPCWLVPGASGAPVVVDVDGNTALVGVLSTVSSDGGNGIGVSDGVVDLIAGKSGVHVELVSDLLPKLAQNRNAPGSWWLLVELISYVEQESAMGATVLRGVVPSLRGDVLELYLPVQVRRRLDVASERAQDKFFAALERYREEVGIEIVLVG